ncbi:MAG: hypothetical protein JSS02_13540 [Planctomycetes bacterium]|nr:hypothetical protein [Planctomycetota bacterium]
MFSLVMNNDSQWAVTNEAGETTFQGTMRDCEDWLDGHENVARAEARVAQRRPIRWGRPRLSALHFEGLRRWLHDHHTPLFH